MSTSKEIKIVHLTPDLGEPLGPEYGGKAVMLSKLIMAGLPVPKCMAIDGVSLYWVHRHFNSLSTTGDYDLALRVRQRFCDSLFVELRAVSGGITFLPLAVRSSAVGEDGSHASFAGRYESVLGIYGAYEVINAIDNIVNSASDKRVLSYMKRHGMEQKGVGIIIQQMIEPSHAAIVFTRNPLDGAEEMVIEVVSGLGDALVGGAAIPTMTIVAKQTQDGGVETFDYSMIEFGGGLPSAPDLESLVQLAKRCEDVVGGPADIEAAYDGVMWWILQARPITTLE